MLGALRRTARDQFTPGHVLGLAALLGALAALDEPTDTIVGVAAGVVVLEVHALFRDTPGVDERYVRGALGVAFLLGSAGLAPLAVSEGVASLWLVAVAGAVGAWLVVDTARAVRRGTRRDRPPSEQHSTAEVLLVMHHAHLVGQELEAGPRTVPELAAACDLTESRVEEALSHMEEGDVVAPRGERYVLLEENTGLLAFLRTVVAGLVGRVTRPFGGLG